MTPQELKTSIYQMAFQGKLVCQLSEEGTAEELYSVISTKYLSKKIAAPIVENEDELPFEIPDTWKWVHLNHIATSNLGKTLDKEKNTGELCPYLCSINVYWNGISLEKLKEARFEEAEQKKYLLQKGDLLVCEGGDVGRSAIWENDQVMYYQNALHRIRFFAGIDPYFYKYLLECYKGMGIVDRYSKGVTIKHLVQNALYAMWIPLPPVAEQKRIVAKIEELLPLIDRYEQAWCELEDFNKRFPVDMQKSILQTAIQGKLVEQRPEEGTALSLKEKLLKKKAEWTTTGKILKKAETKPFIESDDLFDIPESWEWVQLSDVSIIQEGAGIRKWQYRDTGTQILCVTNILEGSIDLEKKQLYISTEEYLEKYKHLTLNKGDIVTSCSGGSWGKIAFFDCEDTMMLNTSTLRMRFFDDIADNDYLYYVCKSPFFKRQLELQLSGMQPNFGYAHYSRIVFPLPPLAEQKRIVAKLEEILPLCERLK